MRPLWFDDEALPGREPAGDPPAREHEQVHGRYDVAVVGAGLTGLVTALMLTDLGHRVVVLEARTVGAGTTGGSTAKVSVLQGTRLSAIDAKHSTEVLGQYVSGNQFGLDWLVQFCAEQDVAIQRPDALTFAPGAEQVGLAEAEHEVARRAGLAVTWRAHDDVPFPFAGGTALPAQAQLDPMELLRALVRAARHAGVTVATGRRVVKVGTERDPELLTCAGPVAADRVVLATGVPIADRGGFFARVAPQRSYLVALHAPDGRQMDMYLAAGAPLPSIRTAPAERGQWILVGGNSHDVARADSEAAQVEELAGWAQEHFGAQVRFRWSAQDYHPIDELPYVGPLTPRGERVLIASGFAKWGFTNAPAAAAVLAGWCGGTTPDWAGAYPSWDSHEVAGAGPAAAHNARVARDLAADRLAALTSSVSTPPEGSGEVARQGVHAVATSTVDGATCTVSATCPHMGGLVRWNDAEQTWDCPLHGSRFSPTGDLLEGPATTGLDPAP